MKEQILREQVLKEQTLKILKAAKTDWKTPALLPMWTARTWRPRTEKIPKIKKKIKIH